MNIIDRYRALRIDLQKHLGLGLAIAFVAAVVVGVGSPFIPWAPEFLAHPIVAALIGFAVGVAAGWLKEYVWDQSGRGVVDRADYLFTGRGAVLGAVFGGLVCWVVGAVQ